MLSKAPKPLNMILCEDIRQESGHKVSLIGVYTEGLIFQIKDHKSPTPMRAQQLAFYASFEPLVQDATIRIRLLDPTGVTILETQEGLMPKSDRITVVAFKTIGLEFKTVGKHKVEYSFDDKKVPFNFNISQQFAESLE
ncbi:hypothetical protein NLO83_04400 [Pseudomonas tremae]|uniref:DUF6941 family protein n=1 Tax=Pseudomonas syringae group TaxID=136849 RepID=UPI0001AF457C|nr:MULTISPECIES: hypothetical protein [Pseudomonas syringae group]MCQ3014850.1 hypothetical protein [Pseudomonas tremae]QGL56621.1 hypothetical protein POR16_09790 [Pseudomonas coronafaciens pv. oryzae str. 1_6]